MVFPCLAWSPSLNSIQHFEDELEHRLWVRPHQCWTSLMFLCLSGEQITASKILWKVWNQKSGGCCRSRLKPVALERLVQISYMGLKAQCPQMFGHTVHMVYLYLISLLWGSQQHYSCYCCWDFKGIQINKCAWFSPGTFALNSNKTAPQIMKQVTK